MRLLPLLVSLYAALSVIKAYAVTIPVQLDDQSLQLELQENHNFKSLFAIQQQKKNSQTKHYSGYFVGVDNSWVSCSQVGGQWSGLAKINSHFYLINSSSASTKQNTGGGAGKNDPDNDGDIELELFDTRHLDKPFNRGVPGNVREVLVSEINQVSKMKVGSSLTGIKASTLQSGTTGNELVQLDLELFLDHFFIDYANSLQLDPIDTATAMVNIADGIYRNEFGIRLKLAGISTDGQGVPPLLSDTSDAENLLNDFESKKNAGAVFSQGDQKIGHLITSRNRNTGLYLAGYSGVVGLSFSRGALADAPILCSASTLGFSLAYLAQGKPASQLATVTAMTMAHEIAHNLGAIHDGSAAIGYTTNTCDANKYIMSAQENAATHYSLCSKQEISDELERVRRSIEAGYVTSCLVDLIDLDLQIPDAFAKYQGVNSEGIRKYQLLNHSHVGASSVQFEGVISNSSARFVEVSASNSTCNIVDDTHYKCVTPVVSANTQINIVERISFANVAELSITNKITALTSVGGTTDVDDQDVISSNVSILDLDVPLAPSAVKASRVENGVQVFWQDNSDVEDVFEIERQTNGGDFVLLSDVVETNSTRYLDQAANDNNARYVYRVTAVNRVGRSESATSSTLQPVTDSKSGGGGIVDSLFISVLLIFARCRQKNLV